MKSFFATLIAASTMLSSAVAMPQSGGTPCTAVRCHKVKPVCPAGEAPSGTEGCWGCCEPIVDPPPPVFCTLNCRPEKPECPEGEAPGGSEGCWGCCQPIVKREPEPAPVAQPEPLPEPLPVPLTLRREADPEPCLAVCHRVKPVCPAGQEAGGSPGCWGCCQPIPCDKLCLAEKPQCREGEEPAGSEGCWGCCQAIARGL